MTFKRNTLLMSVLFLAIAVSALNAQDFKSIETLGTVIRLYQEGLENEIDLEAYMKSGEVEMVGGKILLPPKIKPGPAPQPYPHVHVWEEGIEQLGESPEAIDGIWFINGNIWHPRKWALVRYRIFIPVPGDRYTNEWEKDLTLSLWVDWNQDRTWGQNELMVREHINVHDQFPAMGTYLEVQYLAMFRIPQATAFSVYDAREKLFTAKLWARGMVSYDDPDVSPDGEALFGDAEDYEITYFEQQGLDKSKE